MQDFYDEYQNGQVTTIEDSDPDNFKEVGYDLRIRTVYYPSEDNGKSTGTSSSYELAPGKTVFVGTIEVLNMPLDLVGIIVQRNSLLRRGIRVDAPVYQPGHHTRMFLRVTNVSDTPVVLEEDKPIASIMFEKLSSKVPKYEGDFKDEFDYSALNNYTKEILNTRYLDNKIQSLENIEKSLYEKVIIIITIFVGIFSLINLNINFASIAENLTQMLVYNLIRIDQLVNRVVLDRSYNRLL
jgi:deoxycytidine triphosphate deaminase